MTSRFTRGQNVMLPDGTMATFLGPVADVSGRLAESDADSMVMVVTQDGAQRLVDEDSLLEQMS